LNTFFKVISKINRMVDNKEIFWFKDELIWEFKENTLYK
jgi:hypothetical protein